MISPAEANPNRLNLDMLSSDKEQVVLDSIERDEKFIFNIRQSNSPTFG